MFIEKTCPECHIPFTTTIKAESTAKCPWCGIVKEELANNKVDIKTMEELHSFIPQLPVEVVSDVSQRISDWICSGGNQEDSYIKRQFDYASRVLNHIAEERNKLED